MVITLPKLSKGIYLIIVVLVLTACVPVNNTDQKPPVAVDGVIDLFLFLFCYLAVKGSHTDPENVRDLFLSAYRLAMGSKEILDIERTNLFE